MGEFTNLGMHSNKGEGKKVAKTGKMVKVLSVDQWTSTGNITDFGFADFDRSKVKGGDSEAAKVLFFGARGHVCEVSEDSWPSIGTVWFREGASGKFELYKYNYDSSD